MKPDDIRDLLRVAGTLAERGSFDRSYADAARLFAPDVAAGIALGAVKAQGSEDLRDAWKSADILAAIARRPQVWA